MAEKSYCTAIVLAAGRGSRMGTKIHKQYLLLNGRPVLYYSLDVFQKSAVINEIILVTGAGEEDYCRSGIIEKYGFSKVSRILSGGAERYESVWNGLQAVKNEGYVFIHDGARPFVDEEMLLRAYGAVRFHKACVVGMPVKDTIKIVDAAGDVAGTPDRSTLWMVQTPQVFETGLVKKAYEMLMQGKKYSAPGDLAAEENQERAQAEEQPVITDDAGVVEELLHHPVRLVRGSYQNIKITTPDDLIIGEAFVKAYML